MINQNWWFSTLLIRQFKYCPPLNRSIKCDVLIVGGGFSGVSAAAEFLQKGFSVVLIDRNMVGGSSSGRSAGFLTPDSELELHQLVRRFGPDTAREIWEMPCRGIDRIVQAIKKNNIECGLLQQDSLFLGIGKGGKDAVASERECRESVGFRDQQVYDENELKGILGAEGFTAGIRYTGTYGVNPLLCLQGLKDLLIDNGMQVFESTEMLRLEDHTAAFGVLVLGIIQIGPAVILIPVIIWSWITKEPSTALMFTAYMLPVNLIDNILRPIIFTRGLKTPMLVIIIGVIGGTLSDGIIGLFVGPIVLAVAWALLVTFVRDSEATTA
jgi:hypothetical protein